MGSEKVGVNTGTIINVRYRKNRKARPCNCKKCKYGRVVDGIVYCMISGDVDVKKHSFKYYSGPYISRPSKNSKLKKRKKVKSKPRK